MGRVTPTWLKKGRELGLSYKQAKTLSYAGTAQMERASPEGLKLLLKLAKKASRKKKKEIRKQGQRD